jgi:hypothetical protein
MYFRPFGIFIATLVHFMTSWYFCGHFGVIFSILVHCAKTNLATLLSLKPFLCRREAGVG